MADTYKKIMHYKCGKGGLKCYCCNTYKGKNKKKLNKLARSIFKRMEGE